MKPTNQINATNISSEEVKPQTDNSFNDENAAELTDEQILQQRDKSEFLSAEQEKLLIRRIREGNLDALAELLEGNIRFVISVAKNYRNNGLEMPDLISAGTRGLIDAALHYDESKDFRFISYAIYWIRLNIINAIEQFQ